MAECTQCGAYTKFEKGLCLSCYNANKSKDKSEPTIKTESSGTER